MASVIDESSTTTVGTTNTSHTTDGLTSADSSVTDLIFGIVMAVLASGSLIICIITCCVKRSWNSDRDATDGHQSTQVLEDSGLGVSYRSSIDNESRADENNPLTVHENENGNEITQAVEGNLQVEQANDCDVYAQKRVEGDPEIPQVIEGYFEISRNGECILENIQDDGGDLLIYHDNEGDSQSLQKNEVHVELAQNAEVVRQNVEVNGQLCEMIEVDGEVSHVIKVDGQVSEDDEVVYQDVEIGGQVSQVVDVNGLVSQNTEVDVQVSQLVVFDGKVLQVVEIDGQVSQHSHVAEVNGIDEDEQEVQDKVRIMPDVESYLQILRDLDGHLQLA